MTDIELNALGVQALERGAWEEARAAFRASLAVRESPEALEQLGLANMHHFAVARGHTIVQVHAMGPFALTYVNPKDGPQTSAR